MTEPRSYNLASVIYLLNSFFSGLLELGIPILIFTTYEKPIYLAMSVIPYQLASYLAKYLHFPPFLFDIITLIGIGLLVIFKLNNFFIFIIAVFFLTLTLHNSRNNSKSNSKSIKTAIKRFTRVIGFCLAGLLSIWGLMTIGLCLMICNRIYFSSTTLSKQQGKTFSSICFIMAIHQMHYFVYCYMILYMILNDFLSYRYYSGVLFSIGWVSYILSEFLLKKYKFNVVLIGGHISLAILLLLLWYLKIDSILLLMSLWFLTGFGGGTVFCLRKSNKSLFPKNRGNIDLWEDVGHVLGVFLSMILIILTKDIKMCFLASSFLALLTAILFFIWHKYRYIELVNYSK